MSYKIDTWKQKKCVDFVLTFRARNLLKAQEGVEVLYLPPLGPDGGETTVIITGLSEGFRLEGRLLSTNEIEVSTLNNYGEGSGYCMEPLYEVFSHTRGKYEAVLVSSGGGTVERLTIDDGKVWLEEIDL